MAIWYTDNIAGSDTTGDGTSTTPYKTINKAVSVAASDDTIRVAGSGWTAITGTLSNNGNVSSTTVQTSVNMTSQLTAGVSLISVKDPQFGDRKLIYKVTAVTATSITTHASMGLVPATNYEIEKITTNYYATATAASTFENLSAVGTTLTGIKVEGGWTAGFTAQDGITVMTYTVASGATSGTGFVMAITQTGWLFNNFAFGAISQATGTFATLEEFPVGLGSIWMVNSRFFGNSGNTSGNRITNFPGTLMKIYNTISSTQTLVMPLSGAVPVGTMPFIINELYAIDNSSTSYAFSLNNKTNCTIENMYIKCISINTSASAQGGQLYAGNYIVNNLTIGWATDGTNQNYVLFGESCSGKLVANTNLGDGSFKFFGLALPGASQAQWINTSINIDNNAYLGGNSVSSGARSALTSNFVKDSEGEKLLIAGFNPVFADPTVFDTGTNSLRIKKSRTTAAIPIKQHYIPVGATSAITFTIRAKSTASNTTQFAFQPAPGYIQASTLGTPYVLPVTRTLTSEWADYTYTLASEDVVQMAGNYVFFSCVTQSSWSQTYVWIDSVTIS